MLQDRGSKYARPYSDFRRGIRYALGPITLSLRQENGEVADRQVAAGEPAVAVVDAAQHMASAFGVRGVELQDYNVGRSSREKQDAILAALRDHDITLGCFCIENRCIGEAEERYRKVDREYIEGMLAVGSRLGAKTIRVNVHMPPVFPQLGHAPLKVLIEELQHLVKVTAEHGTQLVVENPATMRRILQEVPGLGFILDTGNMPPITEWVEIAFRTRGPAPTSRFRNRHSAILRQCCPTPRSFT